MKPSYKRLFLLLCGLLLSGKSYAAVLYTQTTSDTGIAGLGPPVAVTDPTISGFLNCVASEGCMGNGSTIPVQDFTLNFAISPAQLAGITGSTGTGKLTVTAARDIGVRNGGTPPGTEFLIISGEGTSLGNLYQNLVSTASPTIPGACTINAHNETPPVALDCGPNYDNDFTATESLTISQADFLTFAADGTISILVHPTAFNVDCFGDPFCGVGRLKLFSATLAFNSTTVPEPGSLAIIGSALVAFAAAGRKLRKKN
jgi:hypothetical protein